MSVANGVNRPELITLVQGIEIMVQVSVILGQLMDK